VLLLKLIIVPCFIGLITLAGRRWGPRIAGLLGGLPIVGGPIIFFITLEQGAPFAIQTTALALASCAAIMLFGIAYCWSSTRFNWLISYCCALSVWLLVALILAKIDFSQFAATILAIITLILTPFLLPKPKSFAPGKPSKYDLPLRMAAGAFLTVSITTLAPFLGSSWSGLLAMFPVIGSVLAVFTHTQYGASQVGNMYRGMVRGLYSLVGYFFCYALLLKDLNPWLACLISIIAAITIQAGFEWHQRWSSSRKPH
jgi:uncharacterized membrane protein (GlpM family)